LAKRSHLAALDGLRGIAAVSVVFFHLGHWLGLPLLAANSGLAVDLFFCLSGYVLCVAYRDRLNHGLSAFAFLKIRLIRLWPLMALATVLSFVFVVLRLIAKDQSVNFDVLILALVLGLLSLPFFNAPAELGGPQVFPLNGPQYTLFLELLANLVWVIERRWTQRWLTGLMTAIALSLILVMGLGGDQTSDFWSGVPRVLGSYFLGVMIYSFRDRISARIGVPIFWAGVLFMLILFYMPASAGLVLCMLWIVIVSPALVLTGASIELPPLLNGSALWLGRLSYPIYALHYPIFCWVNGAYLSWFQRRDIYFEIPLCFAAIMLGSYAALALFDEPVRALLTSIDRRKPARAVQSKNPITAPE
jgi:peptidoglycan/LPS O-acetylase OafA/YrhL